MGRKATKKAKSRAKTMEKEVVEENSGLPSNSRTTRGRQVSPLPKATGKARVSSVVDVDVHRSYRRPSQKDDPHRKFPQERLWIFYRMGRLKVGVAVQDVAWSVLVDTASLGARGRSPGERGQVPRSSLREATGSRSSSREWRSSSRDSTRSSWSTTKKRHRSRHGEYDQSNFLSRHQKIDSIEKLLLVNVRLIKQKYEEGEDIISLIDHIEILVEKSGTRVYTLAALSNYDESVKNRANKKGIKAFKNVENSDILRYLSYDGSIIAQRAGSGNKGTKKVVPSQNTCFAYNRAEGCKMNPCRYRHVCSNCGTQGHTAEACKKGDIKK